MPGEEENKGQSQDNSSNQEDANNAGEGQNTTDEITEIAKAVGWKEDGPLDAKTFLRTMPDRFGAQSKELKEIKHTVQGMAKQYKAATEASYKRGIAEAEARMKIAKESQDFEAFEAASDEKNRLVEASKTNESQLIPEVEEFIARNEWFDKDKVMTADALDYKERYLAKFPGAPPADVLDYVEKKMRRDYPDAFKSEKKEEDVKPPNAVEGAKGGGGGNPKDPIAKLKASLTEDEKRVMDQFVKWGNMTEKDYLEEYAKVRDL